MTKRVGSSMRSEDLSFESAVGSAFDKCGVLYHIGTAGGTCAYANPHGGASGLRLPAARASEEQDVAARRARGRGHRAERAAAARRRRREQLHTHPRPAACDEQVEIVELRATGFGGQAR